MEKRWNAVLQKNALREHFYNHDQHSQINFSLKQAKIYYFSSGEGEYMEHCPA